MSSGPSPWLTAQPYAHRGRTTRDAVENTLAAMSDAAAAGMGIELDVHLGADGAVLVHHDATLERLAGDRRAVAALTATEARRVRLCGTDQTIPTLADVVALVASRVPILVEVKPQPYTVGALEAAVARTLQRYDGPVAVIGFDPAQLAWFAAHAPQLPRGQTAGGTPQDAWLPAERLAAINRLDAAVLAVSRPGFLVCNIARLPCAAVAAARRRGMPVVGWTAKHAADVAGAAGHTDQLICAGFNPRDLRRA